MTDWQKKWARHKYWVMAHSQQIYNQIRQLAKDNDWSEDKAALLEHLLAEAALQSPSQQTLTTAYQHIWGYFKKICLPEEKETYLRLLADLTVTSDQLGPFLKQLTLKYQIPYLMASRIIQEIEDKT